MNQEAILRKNLLALLTGEYARMPWEEVLGEFPLSRINENFPSADYTPWALLEHLRITQWDILDFIKNPHYQGMRWPEEYWPKKGAKATAEEWKKSIANFKKDFEEIEKMVKDLKTDLFKEIPWGNGHTFLREIVTVSSHNGFHLGEFAIMRQAMGTWGKSHRA